jgi:hypothetical protein
LLLEGRALTFGKKAVAPAGSAGSHSPLQTPILNRFGDVRSFDAFRTGEIGHVILNQASRAILRVKAFNFYGDRL